MHVLKAAGAVGTPHIVYTSGLGAEHPQNVPAIDGKAFLETLLRQSGLPFTILRPGLFMDDFLGASLPFPRTIQRILSRHQSRVERLFLATLRTAVPSAHPVPVTSMQDIGRLVVWA